MNTLFKGDLDHSKGFFSIVVSKNSEAMMSAGV